MKTRAWLVAGLGLFAVSGCGKKGAPAGAGSGSAPPPPVVAKVVIDAAAPPPAIDAPPAAPICFPPTGGRLDALTADDRQAIVCITGESNASQCIAISLLTGVASNATHPAAKPAPATGGYTVTDDATQVAVCKNGTCSKLQLHALADGAAAGPPRVVVAPGGTVAIAPLTDADKAKGLGLFDTSSGRKIKALDVSGGDASYGCAEPGKFLTPDVIYAVADVCSGPGARGSLWKLDGTQIGALPVDFNVYGGDPIQLDGDTWAVPTFGGDGALAFDIKSARSVRGVRLEQQAKPTSPVLGDPSTWVSPLARTTGGKLVEVSTSGAVSLIDPATGKAEKSFMLPACQAAPEPAGSAGPGAGSASDQK